MRVPSQSLTFGFSPAGLWLDDKTAAQYAEALQHHLVGASVSGVRTNPLLEQLLKHLQSVSEAEATRLKPFLECHKDYRSDS